MNKYLGIFLLFGLIAICLGDDQFNSDALNAHNAYRKKHCAPPLQLSPTLNQVAQKYAQYLAQNKILKHSGNKYGENLYMGMNPTGSQVSKAWYDEVSKYNYNNPGFSGATGHFTQVVWVSSKNVGFGIAKASNGYSYVVANYDPPGNYLGQFASNVKPPTC